MWLTDLRIVLPDQVIEQGALRVDDGQIAEIVEGNSLATQYAEAISLSGLTAIPGLVDIHGDMLEREVNPRPKAEIPIDLALCELDKRLVATGITTAYAAIAFAWYEDHSTRSDARARELIHTVNSMGPSLLADHRVHARFEIRNPKAGDVLEELLRAGEVHLVSLMDHTPGQGQYRDIERYVQSIVAWRKQYTDENATEEDAWAKIKEDQARPKGWDAARSVSLVSHQHGIPVASHDDDTIDKVKLVHEMGVTISEFPVTEEAAAAAKDRGMSVAMGAPNAFRGGSLSGNLNAAAAVETGLVDSLASDYYPAAMLHSVLTMAKQEIMPLHEAIKLVTQNPADAVGLYDRGRLEVGCLADIAFVEMSSASHISVGYRNGTSTQEQRPRVRGTMRHGKPIYWDEHMMARTWATKQPA